jgi:FeS assembly SUF system protein
MSATPDKPTPATAPADLAPSEAMREAVIDVLRTVFDPEIPVNIWELGLVYTVEADAAAGEVLVTMTLTSPACPVAGTLPGEVERKILGVPGVKTARVELTWEPAWTVAMMSDSARLELGFL